MLNINDKAPLDISLVDQDGNAHSLRDFLGKFIVVYFYPKDATPGCTIEACSFRDFNEQIKALGAEVIGVSKDNVQSHKKFIEKEKLNFLLLSDPDTELQQAFGTWVEKKMFGKTYMGTSRSTFIIDPTGMIVKVWNKIKPEDHAKEVYEELQKLSRIKK